MSNHARRYHQHPKSFTDTFDDQWDRYLDRDWRRRGLRSRHTDDRTRHSGAKSPPRPVLRVVFDALEHHPVPRARLTASPVTWTDLKRLARKARGELALEYPWLEPAYVLRKALSGTPLKRFFRSI